MARPRMHRYTRAPWRLQRGFTLVELVMVIVIMGVIGGIVAVFMRSPIEAYIATSRRAALTDTADTAVRRMARDIRRALPNSLRSSSPACIEFVPTKASGRYRTQDKVSGDDSSLDFSKADTTFNLLGSNSALPAASQIGAGDLVVVYNLGIADANFYAGDNYSAVASTGTEVDGETPITIAAKQFPLASGSNRFHVVAASEQQVAYVCSAGKLYRNVRSAPSASASCAASGDLIATHVDCAQTLFTYTGSDLTRNGLVSMVLSLQDSSGTETVTLQHEVHVGNTP